MVRWSYGWYAYWEVRRCTGQYERYGRCATGYEVFTENVYGSVRYQVQCMEAHNGQCTIHCATGDEGFTVTTDRSVRYWVRSTEAHIGHSTWYDTEPCMGMQVPVWM